MALVNGGFLHYMDMKKFFKNFLLGNSRSDFEVISQEYSLGDPLQILFAKFWSVYKHGSGEWGYLPYTDMKKFLKNLPLRNCWSDFEIILQESGFDISGHCLIQAEIARGKLPSPVVIFGLLLSIRVFVADTGSFWSLRSDKQMDIKLFTEFLKKKKKNDPSKNIAFMGKLIFFLWYEVKSLKAFQLPHFNTSLPKT